VEDLPFDSPAFKHAPLSRGELIEPGGEERVDRRWDGHAAAALSLEREHLLDEQRVSVGDVTDSGPSRVGQSVSTE
jgi:hypothetical protein